MLFFFLILSACNSDDQSSPAEFVNLPFTADNIEGDWKRIAEFRGQPNDSLGILEPTEDLFAKFENCQKDDMIRYVKATQPVDNTYFWGIGEVACHSQIANAFNEIGAWTLAESGKLSHFYSDVSGLYIVVILKPTQLLVRSESGIDKANGPIYEFTEYVRLK
jgi:hypothetical protein